MKYSRWANADGNFVPTTETEAELPPGIYDINQSQGTIFFTPIPPRTDDLLRFPNSSSEAVVEEIERFWKFEKKFRDHGLPYKRGILLHGPPGSGKSCTLQLVARDVIDRGGIVLLFDDPQLFVGGYRVIRVIQPDVPLVVLMEDLETILRSNETYTLNLLDGAERVDRTIFLATTNYPEKLDPRITNRPSRFDRRFLVQHPDEPSAKMYLESLMRPGDKKIVNVEKWSRDTSGLSLAHIKELFVAVAILGSDYQLTLQALKGMRDRPTSADEFLDGDYPTGQYI